MHCFLPNSIYTGQPSKKFLEDGIYKCTLRATKVSCTNKYMVMLKSKKYSSVYIFKLVRVLNKGPLLSIPQLKALCSLDCYTKCFVLWQVLNLALNPHFTKKITTYNSTNKGKLFVGIVKKFKIEKCFCVSRNLFCVQSTSMLM